MQVIRKEANTKCTPGVGAYFVQFDNDGKRLLR